MASTPTFFSIWTMARATSKSLAKTPLVVMKPILTGLASEKPEAASSSFALASLYSTVKPGTSPG